MDLTSVPAPLVYIAIAVLTSLAGVAVVKLDNRVENRRRSANDLATRFREEGVPFLPELLDDYVVGDYGGLAKSVAKFVADLTKGGPGIKAELLVAFFKQLDRQVADLETASKILAKIRTAQPDLISPSPRPKVTISSV